MTNTDPTPSLPSPIVTRAVLGWSNPETAGGASVRLYALDKGKSPRWDHTQGPGGRTIERAIVERDGGTLEGDRYLVVWMGNRFVDDLYIERTAKLIANAAEDPDDDPVPRLLARTNELQSLLALFADPSPCRFDHHGDCQEHDFSGLEGQPCPMVRIRALVEEAGLLDQAQPTEDHPTIAQPFCMDHHPTQHRDGKPPWCKQCGMDAVGNEPKGRLDR